MAELKQTLIRGDLRVSGDLLVEGSSSILNTSELYVKDSTIELASGSTKLSQIDGAKIQFGDQNLGVNITYRSSSEAEEVEGINSQRVFISPRLGGIIDSASHAGEIQWNKLTNMPLFSTMSFVPGVFTSSIYLPTSSRYPEGSQVVVKDLEIRIPIYAKHIGAVDTASFSQYVTSSTSRLNLLEISSGSVNEFSASALGRLGKLEISSGSVNEFSASTLGRLSSLEKTSASVHSTLEEILIFTGSANQDLNTKLPASVFTAWTGSILSNFKGTSSWALTASWAENVFWNQVKNVPAVYSSSVSSSFAQDGPFLPITGGVVSGPVSFIGTFAQGFKTVVSGLDAHAEGLQTLASGQGAHAEGQLSEASGIAAHAEGCGTLASGQGSHAEGINTKAIGIGAHAEGEETIAAGDHQTVVGRYNAPDPKYAFIVGTGTGQHVSESINIPTVKQNALAVQWSGDIDMIAGRILNGTASYALSAPVGEATSINSGSCSIQVDTEKQEILFVVE